MKKVGKILIIVLALVILIAESRPDEMETIISVILNCMQP